MKNILIIAALILFGITNVSSQGRAAQNKANRSSTAEVQKIFNDKDPDFAPNEVPEKWKNESAVVIAQKYKYEYTAEGKRDLNYVETTRRRIKLLDKAAVEKFSTFYFYRSTGVTMYGRKKESTDNFGIMITKANGTTRTIEKKDAIKTELNETPVFFRARLGAAFEYYKVAIPDLEPGDIIDYFLVVHGAGYNFTGGAQALPAVLATMNGDYSVMKIKIDFIVDRGFFINFKSSNGAPDLKKNQNLDRNTYSFSLADQDRNKIDDTRWLYEYREIPTVKFQVCFSQIGRDSRYFLGKIDEPTTSVNAQQIALKVNYWFTTNDYWSTYYVPEIKSRLKRDHGRTTDKNEIAKLAYYYLRNIAFSEKTFSSYSATDLGYMPNSVFARVLYDILKDQDIPCDICVAPDRNISKIDDVVLADELNWFVKTGNDYIFTMTKYSNFKDIDPDLEGQDAYLVKITGNERNQSAVKFTLPVSTTDKNISLFETSAKLDDEMENISVNAKSTLKGAGKIYYNSTALKYYDWEKTDHLAYGGKPPEEEKVESRNKNKIAEAERQKTAKADEERKNKLDLMKEELKDEFTNVVSYDDFQIANDGRRYDAPELIFSEKYKVGDLVKKVGPNYTIDIGLLLGKQVEIDKKEQKRDYNIWLSFARTAEHVIDFEIPAGYKVDGLDALKINIDNATGSFISTPKLEGSKLTLNVKKVYKSNYVKKEDWPKMLEFLDAAYNFTQKKIVLTKGR